MDFIFLHIFYFHPIDEVFEESKKFSINLQNLIKVYANNGSFPLPVFSMEVENVNSEEPESSEIKLMLDSDNQLITSDGQILQLDNHVLTDTDDNQIITSSDGQILIVQGSDNEQLQQLLQIIFLFE